MIDFDTETTREALRVAESLGGTLALDGTELVIYGVEDAEAKIAALPPDAWTYGYLRADPTEPDRVYFDGDGR